MTGVQTCALPIYEGLVSESVGCTATESLGTECAGTEPECKPDVASTAERAGELTKDESLAVRSRKREVAASSRARKSSWSLARRASSKLGGGDSREGGRRCRNVLRVNVRESKVASGCWRTLGGRGCRGSWGRGGGLKGVFSMSSSMRQLICDGNQEGASSMEVIGRRGTSKPSVAKCVAQGIGVKVGNGRFQLDSGVKENGEQTVDRRSSLGPRRGPRRSTTTAGRHTRGMCWLCPK